VTPTTALRGYRPGTWFGILGSGALVLLPPEEKRRVPAVWALVDEGAGFDEVLDALIADGLRDLLGFALLGNQEGDVRVVIRGAVTAVLDTDAGEQVRVEGAAASTWVEREVRHVVGLRLEVDGTPAAGEMLTVRDGVVRADAVLEPLPAVREEPAPEEPPVPTEPTEEPTPDPVGRPVGRPVARLVLSHGETVDVDRPVVLGHAPEDGSPEDGEEPRLVTLPSPSREISGTHLEVRPGAGTDTGTAVVTDLGSTNGSVVVQPGMLPEDLQAGVPVRLLPGAVIELGDGISLEVVAT